MGEKNAAEGKKLNFRKLHEANIIVPPEQRDYAQGRKDLEGVKYQRIRENLITSLFDALYNNKNLVLDYIYCTKKGNNETDEYVPVDGQQRLTTLFLLHWYIAVKEQRHPEAQHVLSKFSYEIRDAAKEFCKALADNSIEPEQLRKKKISEVIADMPWYHEVYNDDPTVCGMLVMLDSIHDKFQNAPIDVFDDLFDPASTLITFWNLSLEEFERPEDLFIKVNARGCELTPFENFKAEIEGRIKEKSYDKYDDWCIRIDNEWLNAFWERRAQGDQDIAGGIEDVAKVETQMFKTILFYLDCVKQQEDKSYEPQGLENTDIVDYKGHIELCANSENTFTRLVTLLDNIEFLSDNESETLNKLFSIGNKNDDFTFSDKAKLYAAMEYAIVFDQDGDRTEKYAPFKRICNNLITGQRNCHNRRLYYESTLSQTSFGTFLNSLKLLTESYKVNKTPLATLQNIDTKSRFEYIPQEIDKLKITNAAINEIYKLERNDKLCGMIHNFVENDKLLLNETEFGELLQVEPGLLLKAILSFSKEGLHQPYGDGERQSHRILYNGIDEETGEKNRVAYSTYLYGFKRSPSGSGELIWTADEKNESAKKYHEPVKGFIKAYSCEKQGTPQERINKIIKERIPHCCDDVKIWLENDEIFFAAVLAEDDLPYIYIIYNYESDDFRMCFDYKYLEEGHYNPYRCVEDGISVEAATIKGKDLMPEG